MQMKGVDVKDMKTDGRSRYTLRLPRELFDMIGAKANELGLPINALILQILWDWVERKRAEQKAEMKNE